MNRSTLLVAALAVSAAFNLGFAGVFAYRLCRPADGDSTSSVVTGQVAARALGIGSRLSVDIPPLRQRQAALSRQLADLVVAADPDRNQISGCLDEMATANRAIQQRVVESVLAQRTTLPEEDDRAFCDLVHRRLCQPWGGCDLPACCFEDQQN